MMKANLAFIYFLKANTASVSNIFCMMKEFHYSEDTKSEQTIRYEGLHNERTSTNKVISNQIIRNFFFFQ